MNQKHSKESSKLNNFLVVVKLNETAFKDNPLKISMGITPHHPSGLPLFACLQGGWTPLTVRVALPPLPSGLRLVKDHDLGFHSVDLQSNPYRTFLYS